MKPITVSLCGYDKVEVVGGPAVWLTRFPAALREHGIDVRVRLLTWDEPEAGIVLQSLRNQKFDVSSHRFADTQSNVRHFLNDISNSRPDIFVPNLVTPAFFASRWARASGIHSIGVLHSDDAFYRAIQEEFIFGKPQYAMSAVVCVSEELMRQISAKQPPNTLPVRIPYGVPTPSLAAHRSPGYLRIGFVGRLVEEQKRISEVARAFCRVTRELDGVEAIIYGDGPAQKNVEQIILAEGSTARVRLAGAVPSQQVQARLADECDTIVLLSDYEGLPISLLEAMACGLVPVCLRIRSGVPELVQDGVTGLLVSDRQESFVRAIRRLRDSANLWSRMSRAARERVRAQSSMGATAERWVELFRTLNDRNTSRKGIRLPRYFWLPPVNPALAGEDHRIERPVGYRRIRKLWGSIRRFGTT